MKTIPVSPNSFALVDDEDFDRLSQSKWHLSTGYAIRPRESHEKSMPKMIAMHRLILDPPKDLFTDHINRNRLDNRRSNLRACTPWENNWNGSFRKDNKSGYRGVHWDRDNNRWAAGITVHNKKIHLGIYKRKEVAALAYKWASRLYFGKFREQSNIVLERPVK